MKIQELAIVFILIIFPISLLLSEYTQFQIKTLNMQTEYDSKLTAATYDAIKAFQINAKNETYSAMVNPKMENIEASVKAFRNSIKSTFELNGYTEENINNYIPALVFTLYDGFYIYSPFENINYRYDSETGEAIDGNEQKAYGLKSFITYSCRYQKGTTDVVITYALDNYITVEGMVDGQYVSKGGYLIELASSATDSNGVFYNEGTDKVTYNGITIETEKLMEYVPRNNQVYSYAKINGTKYYFMEDYFKHKNPDGSIELKDCIVYISNGISYIQAKEGEATFDDYKKYIHENKNAIEYYKQAYYFTKWFKSAGLDDLTYGDAYDQMVVNEGENKGKIVVDKIWPDDDTKIFVFKEGDNPNIENELSNFNQHRLKVIRRKIEVNLSIAIANYNSYSNAENVFQMPLIKEDEWDQITHNISLISFLQGLPIGGKIYNGYTLVTNSESEEVVMEEYIYILGNDGSYHRVADQGFKDGSVKVDSGTYQGNTDSGGGRYRSAGRLNLDFESVMLANDNQSFYYYPLKNYNASYNSVVMQNKVETYDDIYKYINESENAELKTAFYTALGRERASKYNTNIYINTKSSAHEEPELPEPEIPDTIYTISYDANGGTGAPDVQIKTHGIPLTLTLNKPERTGYTFIGWSTTNDSSVEHSPGSIYTTEGDATLYAVWEVITYTITFNANGGTGAPEAQTKIHGTPLTLSSNVPTRIGYKFMGWSTTDDSSVEHTPGSIYTTEGDATLYAVWDIITYTITYNANGGTGGPSTQTKTHGINLTLSSQEPTRTGYKFMGWSTTNDSTVEYNSGSIYTTDGDATLYAVWEVKYYTISYDNNGGSKGPSDETIQEGKTYTVSSKVPEREGWKFKGWDSSAGGTYYGGNTFVVRNNVTLTAKWELDWDDFWDDFWGGDWW